MIGSADFSRYKNVIPQERTPALIRDLSRVPDFSWLLTLPTVEPSQLQGDMINDVPICVIAPDGDARKSKSSVMVLNNSCDLPSDRASFITVVPVYDFDKFIDAEKSRRQLVAAGEPVDEQLTGYIRSVRANDVSEIMYLPQFSGFDHGAVVFLDRPCSISRKIYQEKLAAGEVLASFTQTGFYYLLMKLANHLARMEAADVLRVDSSAPIATTT